MKYRYQVSEAFKQECKANFATSRQGKIHIVEDNIDITGENYEGKLVNFTIDDNCYVNDKFIGTTVSKKITVNILNPNNGINLENKTIKPYAGINNEYVPFSTFIIEKTENKEYEEKTSFTGYDYMVKFKTPYVDTNTYPTTIGNVLKNLCNFVGLELGTTTFVNSDYVVMGNPFTNNEECILVLSNIAQLAGGFAHIGRDDKLYIVNIGELIKGLSVENVHEIQVSNLNETLIRYFKNDSGTSISDEIDGNTYYTLQKNLIYGEVNKVTLKLDNDIDGEETSLSDEKSIKDNGLTEITITGNYFLTNENDRKIAIEQLWETLRYLKYLPFKIEKYYGFPYLDVGDAISIVDSKDTAYRSYIFNHSFKYDGGFSGSIETTAMTKTQEQYKSTTVKEKFRKVELSVDKINGKITAIIDKQTEDEEKLTQLELGLDGITATVANNKEEINEALQTTRTELETQIKVSAEGVESNVSKTLESYSTTEETNQSISNAKTEAINSANTNTDNKLKNYSTTTQMNSAIQQKADSITSTVESKITTAVNEIEVGGRNLLKNSKQTISNSNYNIATFQLTEAPVNGEEYTFSLKGTLGTGKTAFHIYNSGGSVHLGALKYDSSKDIYTLKFNWTNTSGSTTVNNTHIYVYAFDRTVTATSSIQWVKLEKGNKVTDWTPAPEDIENKLTTTETKVTKIEQNLDSITQSVTAIKDNITESVVNGDFKNNLNNWTVSSSGIMEVTTISNIKWLHMCAYALDVPDSIQQKITTFIKNTQYKLAFIGYATNNLNTVNVAIEFYNISDTLLSSKSTTISLSKSAQSYNWDFSTPSSFEYAILKFWAIGNPDKEMYFRDISITGGALWQRVTELQLSVDGMQSEVKEKVGNDEIISKINQSSEAVGINANKIELSANDILNLLAGNTINLSSKNIVISSDKFNLSKDGKVNCSDIEITGGKINVQDSGNVNSAKIIAENLNTGDKNIIFSAGSSIKTNNSSAQYWGNYFSIGRDNGGSLITEHISGSVEDGNVYFCVHNENSETLIEPDRVKSPNITQTSLESQKKNFEKLKNAIDIIKSVDIYKYNLKNEEEGTKKHIGFVIGDKYKYSKELTSNNNDGADIYSLASCCLAGIQEQQKEIEQLKAKIKEMEEK